MPTLRKIKRAASRHTSQRFCSTFNFAQPHPSPTTTLTNEQLLITFYLVIWDIKYNIIYLHIQIIWQNFMNRIKEVLEEKGIKQKWLAEKLGKSYNMVNSYIQNRQQPRLEVLFEIAEILGVEAKELLRNKIV